jgi:activator of HSP90 ATPase
VENKKIVQKWRFNDWEENLYSTVTITLDSPEYGETILHLVHAGIPQSDRFGNEGIPERVADGWNNHFWNRISKICGFEIV